MEHNLKQTPTRTQDLKEIAFLTAEAGNATKAIAPRLSRNIPPGDIDSDALRSEVEGITEEVEKLGGQLTYTQCREAVRTYRTIMEQAAWAWELYSYTTLFDSLAVPADVRLATLEKYRSQPKKLVKRVWREIKGTRMDNSMNKGASKKQKAQDFLKLAQALAEMEPDEAEAVLAEMVEDEDLRSIISKLLREQRKAAAKNSSKAGSNRNPDAADPVDVVLKHLDTALGGADRALTALNELGLTEAGRDQIAGMASEISTRMQEILTLVGSSDMDTELEHLIKGA